MVQIMRVLRLEVSEGASSRVSLESRKGMWLLS